MDLNLKQILSIIYQRVVSLMMSLACSVRIWSTLVLLNLCYNCFYYNDLLLIFLQPSTEASDKILWRLTASQKFKWTGMFVLCVSFFILQILLIWCQFCFHFSVSNSFFQEVSSGGYGGHTWWSCFKEIIWLFNKSCEHWKRKKSESSAYNSQVRWCWMCFIA